MLVLVISYELVFGQHMFI